MPKAIPDRWLNYTKIGQRIEGTRFVAFKTPLTDTSRSPLLQNEDSFSPDDLFELRPDLGLVIDLTNTDRYYSPDQIRARGVQYRKVKCQGQQVPSKAVTEEFHNAVAEFLLKDARAHALIGVHCTHGVNRTGYLICHYMIRRLAVRPRDAIAAFAAARGHGIERMPYVRTLWDLPPAEGHRPHAPSSVPNTAVHNPPSNRTSNGYTGVLNNSIYTVLNPIGSYYYPLQNTSASVFTIPHLNYTPPRSRTANPGHLRSLPSSSTFTAPVPGPVKVLVPTKNPVPFSAKVPVPTQAVPGKGPIPVKVCVKAPTKAPTPADPANEAPPRKKRNKKTKNQKQRERRAAAAAAGGVAGASMAASAAADLGSGCVMGLGHRST